MMVDVAASGWERHVLKGPSLGDDHDVLYHPETGCLIWGRHTFFRHIHALRLKGKGKKQFEMALIKRRIGDDGNAAIALLERR